MNFGTGTNPTLLVNMAGTALGYPSIINNNIQGLSINYSNHIIQQTAPQVSTAAEYAAHTTANLPISQLYKVAQT